MSLATIFPALNSDGLDLLEKLLKYQPSERMSAKNALEHPFFKDISENLRKLYSSN